MNSFLDTLVKGTEGFLTWSARRKFKRKLKQQKKNFIVDWIEAFIWAACVVLLINQYAFQAYEIPSSSMENTLLVHDRIFVNKFIYGPELLPGVGKLPGIKEPKRGDIIIFESPDYLSQGPVVDIAQRLIYMVTLSLVDIDKGADGKPKVHFLIKRAAGYNGDTVRFRQGDAQFMPDGENVWKSEDLLKRETNLDYKNHRDNPAVREKYYQLLPYIAKVTAFQKEGLTVDPEDKKKAEEAFGFIRKSLDDSPDNTILTPDDVEIERLSLMYQTQINPSNTEVAEKYQKAENGIYVPRGWVLPLGDNRDNSHDGRYFGPIPGSKVLGQAAIRYWPLARLGGI